VEGRPGIGTRGRERPSLLSKLWSILDPSVDALPAHEVIDHVLERIRVAFGASAAALSLDGLTEARSPRGGMLGEERVRRLLAAEAGATAEELATRLAALAESYSGRRRDDLALLVVRVAQR
jgi:stage II sporulation SpoE-like protein